MPIAVALRFALLALGAAGETEGPAQKNIAAVRKWAEVGEKMTYISDAAKMVGYGEELASLTTPKMGCAFAPGTALGFDLKDVSISDCMAAISAKWFGLQQVESGLVSVAVVPDSGGKKILTEWRSVMEGVTGTGAAVPSSTFSYHDVVRFDFDDTGLIAGMTVLGDDGVVSAIQQKVKESLAKRNVATTMKFGEAFQKLNGNTVSPEAWLSISNEFAQMTTPKMACAWAPGLKAGFDLKGVSISDCLEGLGSTCADCNVKLLSQEISSVAVDPGGKTTISEWQNVVEFSGTRLTYPDVMRLDFDDDGLVVAMKVIGDDGLMATLKGQTAALASSTIPGSPFVIPCGTVLVSMAIGAAAGAWAVAGRRGRWVREPTLLG